MEKQVPRGLVFGSSGKNKSPRDLFFPGLEKTRFHVTLCSQPSGSSDLRSGGCLDALQQQWRPDSSVPQLRAYINYSMHHAVIVQKTFAVKGCLNSKPCVLETMEVATGTSVRHLCRVNKNDSWLLKCCAGREARKGVLKRSKVLETLKKKLGAIGDSVVTDSISPASEEGGHDPMSFLDNLDESAAERSPKKPKYCPKRLSNRVHKIQMPVRPPESGDSAVAGQRQVHVLARGTNQLWIDVNDIPWLINYVAAEVALGGVPEQQDDSDAEGGNCEVKGLRMKYDFANRVWEADFVEGPLRGKSFTSNVASMNLEKWATVQAAVAVDFENATVQQLKEGTRVFLMRHCQTIEAEQLPAEQS